jgi:hypothetical protein
MPCRCNHTLKAHRLWCYCPTCRNVCWYVDLSDDCARYVKGEDCQCGHSGHIHKLWITCGQVNKLLKGKGCKCTFYVPQASSGTAPVVETWIMTPAWCACGHSPRLHFRLTHTCRFQWRYVSPGGHTQTRRCQCPEYKPADPSSVLVIGSKEMPLMKHRTRKKKRPEPKHLSCFGCKARLPVGCVLGYRRTSILERHLGGEIEKARDAIPAEPCPKPRSYDELILAKSKREAFQINL